MVRCLPGGRAAVRPVSGACAACAGCGRESACAAAERVVRDPLGVKAGDRVYISRPTLGLWRRLLLLALPLLAFLAAYWAAGSLGTGAAPVSAGAFLLGAGLSALLARRFRKNCAARTEIVEVI